MRFKPHQRQAIIVAAQLVFGNDVKVWLFGSRLDDAKRGGDIDLLISTEANDELIQLAKFKRQLYQTLGEQKIDGQILQQPPTAFQQLVLENAVCL